MLFGLFLMNSSFYDFGLFLVRVLLDDSLFYVRVGSLGGGKVRELLGEIVDFMV